MICYIIIPKNDQTNKINIDSRLIFCWDVHSLNCIYLHPKSRFDFSKHFDLFFNRNFSDYLVYGQKKVNFVTVSKPYFIWKPKKFFWTDLLFYLCTCQHHSWIPKRMNSNGSLNWVLLDCDPLFKESTETITLYYIFLPFNHHKIYFQSLSHFIKLFLFILDILFPQVLLQNQFLLTIICWYLDHI